MDANLIILFFAYLIPLYIANSIPILLHGKSPLDFGRKIFGKRILGDGKSILGTLNGIIIGSLVGIIFALVIPSVFILIPEYILLAFLLALGAMLGDITESFFKRRIGFKRGEKWLGFDQLDFVIGGLILSLLIRIPEIEIVLVLLVITIFMHIFTNIVAFKLKLKKVPW